MFLESKLNIAQATNPNEIIAQANQKGLRDMSNLKLNSFTSKRAEFNVLPKPGDIVQGNASCISLSDGYNVH